MVPLSDQGILPYPRKPLLTFNLLVAIQAEDENSVLNFVVGICIWLNLLSFSLDAYDNPTLLDNFVTYTEDVTGWIFCTEAAIRVVALGCSYFKATPNIIDFLVVVSFLTDQLDDSLDSSKTVIIFR